MQEEAEAQTANDVKDGTTVKVVPQTIASPIVEPGKERKAPDAFTETTPMGWYEWLKVRPSITRLFIIN